MYRMKYCITLLLSLFSCVVAFANNYEPGDTLNVVAINGLSLRVEPNTKSEKLLVMPAGERILVLDTLTQGNPLDTIFGFSGKWVHVQSSQGIVGYVFDAFISTLPFVESYVHTGNMSEPEKDINYGYGLSLYFKDYIEQNFEISCVIEYGNGYDGEGSQSMKLHQLADEQLMIHHQYWEGSSVEVQFKKVRLSELYYLVYQLVGEQSHLVDDNILRNPTYGRNNSCVFQSGYGCLARVIKTSEDSYSLSFVFPCC